MLIAWLCCFLFGATLCPGAPDHSSNSKHPESDAGLRKAILQMMGLKTIPKKGPNDKVQQFMLDLYHQRVNGMETSGNTIRAFRSEGNPLPGQVSTLPGNTWNVFFDVSSLPSQETLTGAELRLPFSVAKSADSESVPDEPSRLNLYQVLKPEKGGLPASTRLIDTTTAAAEGSMTFDLTKTVQHWLLHPKDNFGLQVQLVTSKDSPVFDEKSDETSSADKIPFLVTYSDDPEQVHHHTTRPNEDDASTRRTTGSACQRHAWVIDFDELYGGSSNNFVIAPETLTANYCHGECRFPLSSHMNATNHAVFQVLGNLRDSNIPRPCCAPTKMSTTRMLITENNNVLYKNYSNAVVDECGCL